MDNGSFRELQDLLMKKDKMLNRVFSILERYEDTDLYSGHKKSEMNFSQLCDFIDKKMKEADSFREHVKKAEA